LFINNQIYNFVSPEFLIFFLLNSEKPFQRLFLLNSNEKPFLLNSAFLILQPRGGYYHVVATYILKVGTAW